MAKDYITKHILIEVRQTAKGIKKVSKELNEQGKVIKKSITTTKSFVRQFQAWALSMLFFGMAIKRFFSGITKTSVQSFKKIMESSGYAGTAIQQLSAHFEYLKFTIGSAIDQVLMRFLPMIINIVMALARWVREHPGLVTALLGLGIAIGTLLMLFGIFWLGINGIIDMMIKFGLASVSTSGKIVGLGKVFTTVFTMMKTMALWSLGLIKSAFAAAFGWIIANPILALMVALAIFVLYLTARFKTVDGALAWLAVGFNALATIVARVFAGVAGAVVTMFAIAWDIVATFINKAIDGYNFLASITPGMKTVSFSLDTGAAEAAMSRFSQLDSDLQAKSDATSSALTERAEAGEREGYKTGGISGGLADINITINAAGTTNEVADQIAEALQDKLKQNSSSFSASGVS